MRPAHVALWLCLGGCKAERLGVHLPPTGIHAVNVEDLQRDVFALGGPQVSSRAGGTPGATSSAAWMAERFGQMSLLPAFAEEWARPLPDGRVVVCGRRDGLSTDTLLTLALDDGTDANGTVPMAVTIALAKSVTGRSAPARTLVFCSVPEPAGLDLLLAAPPVPFAQIKQITVVGPLLDGPLSVDVLDAVQGVPARRFSTSDVEDGVAERQLGELDFRGILAAVQVGHGWLQRTPAEGPPPPALAPPAQRRDGGRPAQGLP